MTNPTNAPAPVDQITERLALDVMKWEQDGEFWIIYRDEDGRNARLEKSQFRPLVSWNSWREVEEKIMSDTALWSRFCRHWHRLDKDNALGEYMKADLRSRCLVALQSVNPSA